MEECTRADSWTEPFPIFDSAQAEWGIIIHVVEKNTFVQDYKLDIDQCITSIPLVRIFMSQWEKHSSGITIGSMGSSGNSLHYPKYVHTYNLALLVSYNILVHLGGHPKIQEIHMPINQNILYTCIPGSIQSDCLKTQHQEKNMYFNKLLRTMHQPLSCMDFYV